MYEEVDAIDQGCVPPCPPQITARPLQAAIALDADDQPHIAFLRPAGSNFRVAYQPAPLTGSEPENLDVSDALTPPALHVDNDGTVEIVAHDSPKRFTLYLKDENGWHAAHVDVPDLDIVGSVEIER